QEHRRQAASAGVAADELLQVVAEADKSRTLPEQRAEARRHGGGYHTRLAAPVVRIQNHWLHQRWIALGDRPAAESFPLSSASWRSGAIAGASKRTPASGLRRPANHDVSAPSPRGIDVPSLRQRREPMHPVAIRFAAIALIVVMQLAVTVPGRAVGPAAAQGVEESVTGHAD